MPSPPATASSMNPNPIAIPSMCGIVRRKPHRDPDEASIALFGPGVADIDVANATAETIHGPVTAAISIDSEKLTGSRYRPHDRSVEGH